MPYIAHKRLVTVIHTPVRTVYHHGTLVPIRIHARVRPSVLAAELNRIRHLPRPSYESHIDRYLNSRDSIYFDDEAREIRARVDSLLRRVHIFVPRAIPSDFSEEIVPERMGNDSYIRRLISGRSNAKKEPELTSWYDVPERGNFGNLACVKFVAGKPQSVRRPYYKLADLRPSDIKNDVNFLSYYKKNLQAAENAFSEQPMTEREVRKARALERERNEAASRKEPEPIQQVQREQPQTPDIVSREEQEQSPAKTVQPSFEQVEQSLEEAEIVSEKKEKKKEKKSKDKDVKHEKEEALKRAEAFLIKQTAAARAAEERQRVVDEERAKLELEEQKAWLALKETQEARAKIAERHEIERLEDLRKEEEEKEEKDRIQYLKAVEAEKEAAAVAAAVAAEEQLLQAAEEAIEETRRKEETEERLAEIATIGGIDDSKECDRSIEEPLTIEETYQEREERPCQIINDDEIHIEEDNLTDDREPEEIAFIEDVDENRESGDNQPEVSFSTGENAVTVEEEVTTQVAGEESASTGGEQAMWEAVVADDNLETEDSQKEVIIDQTEEEEKENFDGAEEESVLIDGSNSPHETAAATFGGEEEAATDDVEDEVEESANVAEQMLETSPIIEEVISPSDGIEETFEWGDDDA